jgi:uncharacterized protein (TIGR00255 family)
MTGYGRGEASGEKGQLTVEIRSVNHRYLNIVVRTPRKLSPLEEKLKSKLQTRVERGRLDVYVTLEERGKGRQRLQVDKDLALAYHNALRELQKEFNLPGTIDLSVLVGLPDIFALEEVESDAEEFWPLLEAAASEALDELIAMRQSEGRSLVEDMRQRLEVIAAEARTIKERSGLVAEEYRERLRNRAEELLGETAVDDERLEAEVVYHAERSDITEELVRLKSHLDQFREALDSQGAVGRKLKFIVQELHREINTVGSKAQDTATGKAVVEVKSQIEKLREQVQNVE